MKWRWLAVVSLSFLLSACESFRSCPDPGGIGPADSYHYLTITEKNAQTGEMLGKTAKRVVEEDASGWLNFYNVKDYPFFEYGFRVQGSDLASLDVGTSYMFVSEKNQPTLKLCTTEDCNKAAKQFGQPNDR
jgi:hypothetical protein